MAHAFKDGCSELMTLSCHADVFRHRLTHDINVVAIVFNNSAYGNVRRDQQNVYGNRLLGSDLENPDFVGLAASFGVAGAKVDTPEDLRTALTEALAANAPYVIEVEVPRGTDSSPWPFIHPEPPE